MVQEDIYIRGKEMSIPKLVYLIARFILAGILVASGSAKLLMLEDFALSVSQYGLLPDSLAYAYGYALPFIEAVLGVLFFFGWRIRLVSVAVSLIVISFMVANIIDISRASEKCLTCFGDWVTLLPEIALGIDLFMLGLCGLLLRGWVHK